ncbi:thioredoxin-like protein [Daedaleopsis nitida]|nr:thioredoxin-like protein [Daedaleopsis nitida]
MAQTEQITLYGDFYSPFVHRVQIALEDAKAEYTLYPISPMHKPSWFVSKVNPTTTKIPAMTYGGPKTSPDEPSPESVKLTESLVMVEFIAELFPESKLHPADLVKRAQARLFISIVEAKLHDGFIKFFAAGSPNTVLLDAIEALQVRLPETGFAVGEWSIADISAVPTLLRFLALLERDFGKYPVGEGKKTLEELQKPKFARIMRYIAEAKEHPSVKKTWNEAGTMKVFKKNPYIQRDSGVTFTPPS